MLTKHTYSPESFVVAEVISMLLFHSCTEVDIPDSSVIFDIAPLGPNHQKLMLTGESKLEFS
jgi:hypothetical protein